MMEPRNRERGRMASARNSPPWYRRAGNPDPRAAWVRAPWPRRGSRCGRWNDASTTNSCAVDAEIRTRRRLRDCGERRQCVGASGGHVVQPCPTRVTSPRRADLGAIASSPGYLLSGTRSWKKRWARPSLLTKVPSASVNAPAGSTISAFRAVSCSRWSITMTWRARF